MGAKQMELGENKWNLLLLDLLESIFMIKCEICWFLKKAYCYFD